MIKRLTALMLCCLMLPVWACAAIVWPDQTPGQVQLKEYIARVNANLASLGQTEINAMFECYTGFAALGATALPDAAMPEDVELTFMLHPDCLNTLQLRVSTPEKFAAIAGSCIQAVSPDAVTLQEAMADPTRYMDKAISQPGNSFEDFVETLNGPSPRMYYAYYPNQYSDGVNWLQMTLVFPQGGMAATGVYATETPPPDSHAYYDDNDETGYEGYDYDGGTHLEIFTTATPEPDSAAAEG